MRKGLFIGINDYDWSPLNGCANDAIELAKMFSENYDGSPNIECKVLISDETNDHKDAIDFFPINLFHNTKLTQSRIIKEIERVLNTQSNLVILFFSGHGYSNSLGGHLVSQDATKNNEGVTLSSVLTLMNNATHIREIVLILDCCHSGFAGTSALLGENRTLLRQGVSILSSSMSHQYSIESSGIGLFTSILIDGLKGAAANVSGRITSASLYDLADRSLGAFDQRPVYKANISSLSRLRTANPKVPATWIRKIVDFFDSPNAELPLDKRYEPTENPRNKKLEDDFAILQRLTAASLVYPVGEDHMYFAAINERSCALTSIGKVYWSLVKNKQV